MASVPTKGKSDYIVQLRLKTKDTQVLTLAQMNFSWSVNKIVIKVKKEEGEIAQWLRASMSCVYIS